MNRWLPILAAATALSGCLPFSCTRTESRAVSAADSLSRQIAERVLADTLQRTGTLTGIGDAALEYPRTVLFGSDGRLYVADAERGSIFSFGNEDGDSREIRWNDLQVPWLAGQRPDTIIVYCPSQRAVCVPGRRQACAQRTRAARHTPRGPAVRCGWRDGSVPEGGHAERAGIPGADERGRARALAPGARGKPVAPRGAAAAVAGCPDEPSRAFTPS